MTVKESFNIKGLKTTWGLLPFKDFVASEDAMAVQRLKAAGAVILSKKNVPALGDSQTHNASTAAPCNPWTPRAQRARRRAAALSAGMVALELGSDIGGTVRMPSSRP